MSMRDQEAPEFSFSLRGYDRVQVDEYVAELLEYVIQVEERAATAESALVECRRELASPGSAGISERLAAILALANEEADQIRVRAQAEGAATTQQAASVAERTVAGAHRQRDAIQGEIDDLTATREVLFQRLVELGNEIRDATVHYQEYVPGAAAPAQADVELFDAEAIEGEAGDDEASDDGAGGDEPIEGEPIEDEGAVDEPVADPEADTIMVTSTGNTPDPS
jgi:cell division septum initiation protein DivIVA